MALEIGSVPQSMRTAFRSALELSEESLQTISRWVQENIEALSARDNEDFDVKGIAAQANVTTGEAGEAVSMFMTFLMSGEKPGELDCDLLRGLGLAEFEAKLRALFSTVNIPSQEMRRLRQRGLALHSAIPTLTDVDALCDLRAIFRAFPSANKSEPHSSGVKTLLGFEPVVIV